MCAAVKLWTSVVVRDAQLASWLNSASRSLESTLRGYGPQSAGLGSVGRLPPGSRRRPASIAAATFDLVLAAFTFDNIAGRENKARILRDLGCLLTREGNLVLIVSRPEIYTYEWASFSTKDFPENRQAKSGDKVRIVVTDHADARPVEDILWTDAAYREVFEEAHLRLLHKYEPLGREDEPYMWVNELEIAPWAVYVLERQ